MKILFFSRYFYPHIGGVEKHVLEISRELIAKGHEVTVVCELPLRHSGKSKRIQNLFGGDAGQASMTVFNKLIIYRIPVGEREFLKKFTIWKWLFIHRKLIKDADVIHVHDVFYWWIPFLFLPPRKKIYTTFHGYEGNAIPGRREIFMHRLAAKFSKGTISIGSFYKKWYGTKSDVVIYGGVDRKLLRDSGQARMTHRQVRNDKKLSLVFVGRLESETGIMMYLKAAKILKEKKVDFKLKILGDGSLRMQCEQFITLNNLHAQIIGFVQDIKPYLEKADITFVSRYLSILEAFAMKKFVVAAYNNEIKKDYLTMTPFAKWIAICKDETEIKDTILKSAKQGEKEKVEKAFSWVRNQTWKNVAITYLSFWKREPVVYTQDEL